MSKPLMERTYQTWDEACDAQEALATSREPAPVVYLLDPIAAGLDWLVGRIDSLAARLAPIE